VPETRRQFTEEFREGAVRIIRETGQPIAQVARELGSTPGRWGTGSPTHNTDRQRG
jgi:transposase